MSNKPWVVKVRVVKPVWKVNGKRLRRKQRVERVLDARRASCGWRGHRTLAGLEQRCKSSIWDEEGGKRNGDTDKDRTRDFSNG